MQQFQSAPVGTRETMPTSTDRALRGVFASAFVAMLIASIGFAIARSGMPSPGLTTAMCAALLACQMPGWSRSCARTTSRLFPRILEWAGIVFATISIVAATVSAIAGDGGSYERFTTPSRIANGALLGALCCFVTLYILRYRARRVHQYAELGE